MENMQIDHPGAKRIMRFLGNIKEPVIPIDFDCHTWSLSDKIEDGLQFAVEAAKPATLIVLLCDSYQNANKIGEANKLNSVPNGRWNDIYTWYNLKITRSSMNCWDYLQEENKFYKME